MAGRIFAYSRGQCTTAKKKGTASAVPDLYQMWYIRSGQGDDDAPENEVDSAERVVRETISDAAARARLNGRNSDSSGLPPSVSIASKSQAASKRLRSLRFSKRSRPFSFLS